MATEITTKNIMYEESDGQPMAETDVHRNEGIYHIKALEDRYRNDPNVYVSGNIFVYYEEGEPYERCAPDVLVVFGVAQRERRTYKIWEEGKGPDVVIEITSKKTRYQDLNWKRELYKRLGVKEYYLYDPTADYLPRPIIAYRLEGGDYKEVAPAGEVWQSPLLGLELRLEQGRLRFYDAQSGERLLTPEERAEAQRRAEAAQVQAEVARAEAEVARAQAETARAQAETARAQAETARTEETAARHKAEADLKAMQWELERLRAELQRRKPPHE